MVRDNFIFLKNISFDYTIILEEDNFYNNLIFFKKHSINSFFKIFIHVNTKKIIFNDNCINLIYF